VEINKPIEVTTSHLEAEGVETTSEVEVGVVHTFKTFIGVLERDRLDKAVGNLRTTIQATSHHNKRLPRNSLQIKVLKLAPLSIIPHKQNL
jgi:hypothetical protein